MEMNHPTVRAVCQGVQAPYGKAETLCHSAQSVGNLFRIIIQPGMTPADWCEPQYLDHIIKEILEAICNYTIRKWKFTPDMDSDLPSLIRIRKQLKVK